MTDSYSVSPPLVTPFTADGAVDTDALSSLVETLEARGVDGVVPCGTTGEFASLSDDEYRAVLETTASAADGRVVAGVADTSVASVQDRLETAADAGCDAGLLTAPYFHTANDEAGVEAFFESVLAATPLPLYLYNIPLYVGDAIDATTVASLAEHDRLHGIKDTSSDLQYLLSVIRQTPPSFEVLQGYDSLLGPSLLFGAEGGINALANVVPEVLTALTDAVAAGEVDRAASLQAAVAPLFEACASYGFAPATKVAAAERGFVPDVSVRPPLVALAEDERQHVADAVDTALAPLDVDR